MEYKPHGYQSYCIKRIVEDSAVGLFLRPGLGKTSITLSAINVLKYYRWSISKALVVAPKKVAEATWSKESEKWDHTKHLRVVTVLGTQAKRIKALNTPGDVYVVNRENIPWLVDYYKQAWPFDMVVLDESTSFKNPRSQRFKALKLVRRFMKKVVLLTGTPSARDIMDLWAQVYLLDEGVRLGRTITAFRDMYFNANTHGGHFTEYTAKEGAEEAVLNAVKDICISMTAEDYLELPDLVTHDIPVELDSKSRREYKKFEHDMLLEINEDVITASMAGVLTNKLLQFCSGAVYDENRKVIKLHDCKLDAYMELLERLSGERCITFYGFQHDRERLLEALSKTKLCVRVYKDAKDEEAWNAGEVDVLLVHPASCAYGLNLQAGGQHIIWFTPNWSFELNDQGICRLYRQGSPYNKIYVHYLIVTDSVDEDVKAAIADREHTHENVMKVLRARIRKVKELM